MTKKLVPIDTEDLEELSKAHAEVAGIIEVVEKMKAAVNKANDISYNLAFYNRVAKEFIRDLGLWDQWDSYYTERKNEENQKKSKMN